MNTLISQPCIADECRHRSPTRTPNETNANLLLENLKSASNTAADILAAHPDKVVPCERRAGWSAGYTSRVFGHRGVEDGFAEVSVFGAAWLDDWRL